SGEARARAFLDLPGAQEGLVDAVRGAGKPIVSVIMAGRPLTFHNVVEQSGAVLYGWHPGTMGGPASAKLLWGQAAPSGRLPVTFPRTVGQVPIYYSHLNTGRPPAMSDTGIPVGDPARPEGYTSKYIDVDFTPEYPFGYGLTYTRFEYSKPRISSPIVQRDQRITVTADIVNRGDREGVETAQLYIHQVAASVAQPVRRLRGFQRITLKPRESQTVSFTVSAADLAVPNSQNQLGTERGRFQVWIAPDAVRGASVDFEVR